MYIVCFIFYYKILPFFISGLFYWQFTLLWKTSWFLIILSIYLIKMHKCIQVCNVNNNLFFVCYNFIIAILGTVMATTIPRSWTSEF